MKKFFIMIVLLLLMLPVSFAEEFIVKDDCKYVSLSHAAELWKFDYQYFNQSNVIKIEIKDKTLYLQIGNSVMRDDLYLNPFFIDSDQLMLSNGEEMRGVPFVKDGQVFVPLYLLHRYLHEENFYDVIVVGGDPEGIAGAISAARNGAKTLLLSSEDGLGGLLTFGMLNTLDMNFGPDSELLTRGIFEEFYDAIDRNESFDVEEAKQIFSDMVAAEENITLLKKMKFEKSILEENVIKGITAKDSEGKEHTFYATIVIDATQDGDVCAEAGVPYFVGMQDLNMDESMAVTLVFKVAGVDWNLLEEDIARYREETGDLTAGLYRNSAWGFGKWCYDNYNSYFYNMKLRGPNMGLQKDGTVLVNALQIFYVDPEDPASVAQAKADGAKEADNVVKYLKTILESFENAYLAGVADELYIRETRHIQGEYLLKGTDLLEEVNFYDKIAMGSYSVDIQSTQMDNNGFVVFNPSQYSIPYRCIVPQKIDNLFIVGKSASYSSIAAGSTRVVPVGMVTAESAGAISMYCIQNEITPREIVDHSERLRDINQLLVAQGVYLPEYTPTNPLAETESYEDFKDLIDLGVMTGGYYNEFKLKSEATFANACAALIRTFERSSNDISEEIKKRINSLYSFEKVDALGMAKIVALFYGEEIDDLTDREVWELAEEKEYLENIEDFNKYDTLTFEDVYVTIAKALEKAEEEKAVEEI
ncbi:MAG: FAD-dependent oxidoreductase [Clostridia bacterium]|nr:FAD-dependent oxidoreductase [Clostridia bacterium]